MIFLFYISIVNQCMYMCANNLKMHFFLVWHLILLFWREKSCHYCTIEESEWTNLSKESRTNLSKQTLEHPFTGSIMFFVLSTNCQNQLSLDVNQNHFSLVETNFHDRYQSQLFIVIYIFVLIVLIWNFSFKNKPFLLKFKKSLGRKRIEIKWKVLINCSLFLEYLIQNKIALNGQIRKTTDVLIFSNKKASYSVLHWKCQGRFRWMTSSKFTYRPLSKRK